jgi:hypothetical protein
MSAEDYRRMLRSGNLCESRDKITASEYIQQAKKILENSQALSDRFPMDLAILEKRVKFLQSHAHRTKDGRKKERNVPKPIPASEIKPVAPLISSLQPPGPSLKPPSAGVFTPPHVVVEPEIDISPFYGILWMHWDERAGPTKLGVYPSSFKLGMAEFMQIYSNHQAVGEEGMLSVANDQRTFISYSDSSPKEMFLVVVANSSFEPDSFEDELKQIYSDLAKGDINTHRTADEMEKFLMQLRLIAKK